MQVCNDAGQQLAYRTQCWTWTRCLEVKLLIERLKSLGQLLIIFFWNYIIDECQDGIWNVNCNIRCIMIIHTTWPQANSKQCLKNMDKKFLQSTHSFYWSSLCHLWEHICHIGSL
jgi:hypothetical protein